MNHLDLTLPTPAGNLACDEALLDEAEASGGLGVLRFWESPTHFVVLGYANKVREEADLGACEARGIPILRRCSGGGTVLQGPACLNYSVVLRITGAPELQSITGANRFVMERNRRALASLTGGSVTIEGHTDLALGQLKFSGNAQRRKRDWLLFHGTFLLHGFDTGLISKCLLTPPRQPVYRRGRSHADFITRLNASADDVKSALREAWGASLSPPIPHERISRLVDERYSREEWNFSR
jgi:lipoate-protein ligase A